MSKAHKLSLKTAIFMNLNIIAGAGLFINTILLTKITGILSCFTYLFIGICMLPLIQSIAQLVKMHPSGGFYAFSKPVSPFLAFMTCWVYFFSKLASGALILYVSANFLQQTIPTLNIMHTTTLSLIILTIFTYFNLFNLHVGSFIQKLFFGAKAIPISIAIFIGIYALDITTITAQGTDLVNFAGSIPFVIYCLAGFEATCSISRKIENPTKNGPKAIFYSFLTIIMVYTLFQFFVSTMLLPHIEQINSYTEAFSYICQHLDLSATLQAKLTHSINFLISFSALGGAYGILFSNTWNLYTLAEHKHTFASEAITALNNHHIPTMAVLIESIICFIFIILTQGNQIPLQQTAAFGSTIAYSISVIALIYQIKKFKKNHILALVTCMGLLVFCIASTIKYSITSLNLLAIIVALGAAMYWSTKK